MKEANLKRPSIQHSEKTSGCQFWEGEWGRGMNEWDTGDLWGDMKLFSDTIMVDR